MRVYKRKPRATSFKRVHEYIKDVVNTNWNSGIPLTRDSLRHNLIIHVSSKKSYDREFEEFSRTYIVKNDSGKALNTFIGRSLDYCGFKARKSSVCQKLPTDWKSLALEGALRVRTMFREHEVDVVLSSDETFVKFHESTDMVLVPKGTKKVGSALKYNEKDGCTVMVTLDMLGNRVLPPLIVFSGGFGKTNMKKYKSFVKATVLFTKTHWMTVHCLQLYFKYLSCYYSGKRVGLVFDSAPTHLHKDLSIWLEDWNKNPSRVCEFCVDFIDPNLTSVYQPPDVFFNKPFKQTLRKKYNEYVSYLATKGILNPGDIVTVTREVLIDFICSSFDEANAKFQKNRDISKGFEMCGLNPYCYDDSKFKEHLESLDENIIYDALTRNQQAVDCGAIDIITEKEIFNKHFKKMF